jgi:hypothetical protein
MTERIKIDGLRELQKSLRKIDTDLPKRVRLIFNGAAELVIDHARPRIPTRTGSARNSVKARSGQRAVRIAMGGRKAPHMPWLDFGGAVGPQRSVTRPFVRDGRYLYAGLKATHSDVTELMAEGLAALVRDAGLEVT